MTATQTFYRTYKFRKNEKDPIIDRLRTVMDDTGSKLSDLHKDSGVSKTTLYNWFDGPTRRPQFASICATARAMGHDLVLVPTKNKANGKPWNAADVAPLKIVKRFPSATKA